MFTFLWLLKRRHTCEIQIPTEIQHAAITRGSSLVSSLSLSGNNCLDFSPHHELLWSVLEKPYKWNFYVHFHVRFLSLSIKFLRFIYNVVCINSLIPFYFWVVLHSRNIHSFVYLLYFRHLDYFKLLAILNALAIIIILY